jgi:hypothetical protein
MRIDRYRVDCEDAPRVDVELLNLARANRMPSHRRSAEALVLLFFIVRVSAAQKAPSGNATATIIDAAPADPPAFTTARCNRSATFASTVPSRPARGTWMSSGLVIRQICFAYATGCSNV